MSLSRPDVAITIDQFVSSSMIAIRQSLIMMEKLEIIWRAIDDTVQD
jgi:hypothetical protein